MIQDRYSRLDTISGHDFEVQFQKNTIQLAIPRTGLYLNGWKISPLGPSVVSLISSKVIKWSTTYQIDHADNKGASGYIQARATRTARATRKASSLLPAADYAHG